MQGKPEAVGRFFVPNCLHVALQVDLFEHLALLIHPNHEATVMAEWIAQRQG
jgi:hypothetical protein